MTAHELFIARRPNRRDHLMLSMHDKLLCGTQWRTITDVLLVTIPMVGGATVRLRNELARELGDNTCMHCTRIAIGMLALYVSRDTGRMP